MVVSMDGALRLLKSIVATVGGLLVLGVYTFFRMLGKLFKWIWDEL